MTALLDVKAFNGMDSAELDRIEASSRVLVPRDGARLFVEGDAADAVYAIMTGHVRVGAPDTNSKGLMIDVFGPGDIFGEMGVIERSTRTADAVAEGRVRLLRISSKVFLDTLHCNAVLGENLCLMLVKRLRRTSLLFRDATFESLEVRLASQLIYLVNREGGRKTEYGFQLAGRYRQGDLADLLGTTTRSIITILNSWRKDGIVIYDSARGHLTICREDDLQQCILACRNRTKLGVASDLAKAWDGD
jgi:CRP/FNR family transcriptional regulator, cyclic AMP receptor protein